MEEEEILNATLTPVMNTLKVGDVLLNSQDSLREMRGELKELLKDKEVRGYLNNLKESKIKGVSMFQ